MLIYYGTTEIKSLQYERNLERFDTAQKEEEDNGGKIGGRHTDDILTVFIWIKVQVRENDTCFNLGIA